MKTDILNTIKNPTISDAERFNILFDFYKKSPSKNRNYEATFNRIGYTEHYLKKLIYEVRQVYKISDVEMFQHQFPQEENQILEIDTPGGSVGESSDNPSTIHLKAVSSTETDDSKKEHNPDAAVGNSDYVLKAYNPELNNHQENHLPLREEFTFLNDADCPEEFKILVADKISAYNKMVTGRGALDDPNTPEEQRAELAQSVAEADQLNSLIYDELKHYQETGEILGKHEIFATHNLKKDIELMTAEQKVQRVETIKNSIRVNKGQLTKAENSGDTKKAQALAEKIKLLETERDLVIKSLEKSNN